MSNKDHCFKLILSTPDKSSLKKQKQEKTWNNNKKPNYKDSFRLILLWYSLKIDDFDWYDNIAKKNCLIMLNMN